MFFRDAVVDVIRMDTRSQATDVRNEDRQRLNVVDAL